MNASARKAELAALTRNDARWPAIVTRDPGVDGKFYYSVKTTGVYCRPSCAARLARPENVQFHATCKDAENAGFRPCKRCQPDQPPLAERNASKIAAACRLIDRSEKVPSLSKLAARVGMSLVHFHRAFKIITGLSPKDYAAAGRTKKAVYTDILFAIGESSLGSVLVAGGGRGICAVLIGDDPALLIRDLQARFPAIKLTPHENGFGDLVAKVVEFIEKPGPRLDLPLDIRGTAFQQRVWKALQRIPAGSTASYSDIAQKLGMPKSARAVAQACAANPLAVAIPCHRVIRTDGRLSGYRWGVERKRALLDREAQA